MKTTNNNNNFDELFFNLLATFYVVLSILVIMLIPSSCCSIPAAKSETTTTVRERLVTVQGYSTSGTFTTDKLLSGVPLYLVHSTRTNDTVFRMRADQNGNITTLINCPDDTIRVTDTLRVDNNIYVERPSLFDGVKSIFTLIGFIIALLLFGFIVWRLSQWNIFKK